MAVKIEGEGERELMPMNDCSDKLCH